MNIESKDDFSMGTVLIFAARYAHTRKTGGAYAVVRAIENKWAVLSDNVKEQLKKEAKADATCNFEDWAILETLE